jgi:hypothetical protein
LAKIRRLSQGKQETLRVLRDRVVDGQNGKVIDVMYQEVMPEATQEEVHCQDDIST